MIEKKKMQDLDHVAENKDDGTTSISADNSLAMRLYEEDILNKENGWKKRVDFNEPKKGYGVTGSVYSKSMPGFPVDWSRAEGVFKGFNLKCFDHYMKNFE